MQKEEEKKSSNASTTIKTTKNNDNSLYSIEIVFAIENGDFRSLWKINGQSVETSTYLSLA